MKTRELNATEILRARLYINGSWRDRGSGGEHSHVNAVTGEIQRIFPLAGASEMDEAVSAARQALPAWRNMPTPGRAQILRDIDRLLRENDDQLRQICALQSAIVPPPARAATVQTGMFEYYAGLADAQLGTLLPGGSGLQYTTPEPYGVVARISPWNGPGYGISVAAALASGCTVVLKPSELAPFSAIWFAGIAEAAGLPAGVLNVVPAVAEGSASLIAHPGIDKISFTGSGHVASSIQAACAPNLTPLQLELGGKSSCLILDDADVEVAAEWAARRLCFMAGQACIAPTRLLVQRSVLDRAIARVVATMDSIALGDPLSPATQMGPVITAAARDRIQAIVANHVASHGPSLTSSGPLEGELSQGFFIRPTALLDPTGTTPLSREEIFGPVLAITPFDTDDQAVALANDTPYGLAAYLFSFSMRRIAAIIPQLEVGNISVNGGDIITRPYSPFGGFKDSGYGSEGGVTGLTEFLRTKHVNIGVGM